jgi:aminoglycoside/choline kinase family phosphotransferase
VDLLARLARSPEPCGLVAFTPARMAGLVAPFFEHHASHLDPRERAEITGRLGEALERHAGGPTVLALRDFHAGNLVWRGAQEGVDRLGLLDFQDAVLAPAEYDLASLLRDARRDGDEGLRRAMIRRFAAATGREEARVEAAAAVLAVQRNLRILGVFARLAGQGKRG